MNYVTNPDIQDPKGSLQERTDFDRLVTATPKYIADMNAAHGYAELTNYEKRAGLDRYKTNIPEIYSPIKQLNEIAEKAKVRQLGSALHSAITLGKQKKAEEQVKKDNRWAKIVSKKVLAPIKMVNAFKTALGKHQKMDMWGHLLEEHYRADQFQLNSLTPSGHIKSPNWRVFINEVEQNAFGNLHATMVLLRGFKIGRIHRYAQEGMSDGDAARAEVEILLLH
jgi:hypothetical protein